MSVKGIIMFLGMNNTRLERKILIILDFENGFFTYLFTIVRLLSIELTFQSGLLPFKERFPEGLEISSGKTKWSLREKIKNHLLNKHGY